MKRLFALILAFTLFLPVFVYAELDEEEVTEELDLDEEVIEKSMTEPDVPMGKILFLLVAGSALIAVGGVPNMIVCGLAESVTTYLSAVSCSGVYSCASSMINRS